MTDLALGALAGLVAATAVAVALHVRWRRHLDEERRTVDQEIAETERAGQRLARALDAIPQGVVISDGEGRILFHNATGATYSAARHGDALVEAAVDDLIGRAVEGEASVETIELFGPPKRTLVITAVPLDPREVGPGVVAVIDDVTERRRLEAVRRDFVANISHELKTPVGALALLAETIMDEPEREVVDRLAGRMLTESHRVARTIQDLLELSSIEVEEGSVREVVPVRQILAAAVSRIRPAADQRSIRVELIEPSDAVTVVCDRRQLVSAVFNLLENSVKYSEDGSTVRTWAETADGHVHITVEDHGIGIPARDVERVFERFYRVDQARSRQTGGTGLGLAIVRHVVNNHAGEVVVTSREGEGSTFTLRFPVGTADRTMFERTT